MKRRHNHPLLIWLTFWLTASSICCSSICAQTDDAFYRWSHEWVNKGNRAPSTSFCTLRSFRTLFGRRDPDDPRRHIGVGRPLHGTSWRNRPFYIGWAVGALFGDSLVNGQTDQGNRVMGALLAGWDFDHYWATEIRYSYAYLELIDDRIPPWPRESRNRYWDANLIYYPWGDSRWRPYASLGMGISAFRFQDAELVDYDEVLFGLPIGIGLKYQCRNWLAGRVELKDNIAFAAGGLDTMHNVSLVWAIEVHYGHGRTSYFPWNPGTR